MQAITSISGLKSAIRVLEVEQEEKVQELKEQFHLTSERFMPGTLLRNSVKDVVLSPYMIENIIGSAVGLGINYFINTRGISIAGYLIRKFVGPLLKSGVNKIVEEHLGSISSLGHIFIQHFMQKKGIQNQTQ